MSFECTRCAASSASGPRKSHLLSGETSQTPTPSRTAWYSGAGSPKPVTHNQPASSMNPAAVFDMIRWNAVCLLSLVAAVLVSSMGPSYHEFERLFKSRRGSVSSSVTIASTGRSKRPAGRSSSSDLEPEDQADREGRQTPEEPVVVATAVADPCGPRRSNATPGTPTTSIEAGSSRQSRRPAPRPRRKWWSSDLRARTEPARAQPPRSAAGRPPPLSFGAARSAIPSGPRIRRTRTA